MFLLKKCLQHVNYYISGYVGLGDLALVIHQKKKSKISTFCDLFVFR